MSDKLKYDVVNSNWLDTYNNCTIDINKNLKIIKKIITDKNFRPKKLSDQFQLLIKFYDNNAIPVELRLFSLIAASHKAMESLDMESVEKSIKLCETVLNNENVLSKIPFDDDIRKDRVHVRFSLYSVLFHMYFFTGETFKLESLCDTSINYIESLDINLLKNGFYQTIGNVYRLYAIKIIIEILKENEERNTIIEEKLNNLTTYMMYSMSKSDMNKIKFYEYSSYMNSYFLLRKAVNNKEKTSKESLFKLFITITRNHVYEKNEIIRENFKKMLSLYKA